MDLSSLTTADFKRILKLLERKDALLAEIAEIDAALSGSAAGTGKPAKASKPGRKPGKRGKRGKLKDSVLAILQESGKGGITVKEIAAKVNREPANIYTWFFNTGKKIKQVKKVGEAKWAWIGEANPF